MECLDAVVAGVGDDKCAWYGNAARQRGRHIGRNDSSRRAAGAPSRRAAGTNSGIGCGLRPREWRSDVGELHVVELPAAGADLPKRSNELAAGAVEHLDAVVAGVGDGNAPAERVKSNGIGACKSSAGVA